MICSVYQLIARRTFKPQIFARRPRQLLNLSRMWKWQPDHAIRKSMSLTAHAVDTRRRLHDGPTSYDVGPAWSRRLAHFQGCDGCGRRYTWRRGRVAGVGVRCRPACSKCGMPCKDPVSNTPPPLRHCTYKDCRVGGWCGSPISSMVRIL